MLQSAPGRVLPLGLGWEPSADPFGVGHGIEPRHVNHRMVTPVRKIALRALGMAPVGTEHLTPPFGTHHASGLVEVVGKVTGEHE